MQGEERSTQEVVTPEGMITLFPQKEKIVWCKQIRNSLSRVLFQNKNFGNGNFPTLNFSKFQILIFQTNQTSSDVLDFTSPHSLFHLVFGS